MSPRFRNGLIIAGFVLAAAALCWPQPVDAQCGTQASSCKNCHEVQAQDPVNTEGAWHVDHAFGDFCEFCHAGNVTATDADAAHEGMIYPLGDLAGSCSSCHPMDYQDIAVSYAETLGVDLAEVASAPDEGGAAEAPAADAAAAEDTAAEETAGQPGEDASQVGGAVIDLNERYESGTTGGRMTINTGNAILSVLLLGLVGAFGVLIWHFEGLGDRWAELRGRASGPAPASRPADAVPEGVVMPEAYRAVLPVLEDASPATLLSITRILSDDPTRGGAMIEALARIDPRLVEAVRQLDERDMELLIALVRELKDREG